MIRLDAGLPPASCPYELGAGALEGLGETVAAVARSAGAAGPGVCALVSDLGVAATGLLDRAAESLTAAGFQPGVHLLPSGETAKSLAEAARVWQHFAEIRLERRGVVVALGGGSVGDTAGFCAATWMRGTPVVHVPTTLLAMADSSVGGKTAIDLDGDAGGKNLVGAVHQPVAIVADLAALETLPDRAFRSGFAEILKCAILADRPRLASMTASAPALLSRDSERLAESIAFAVSVKLDHVRSDPLDLLGRRALLNLGHTTGHALEAASGWGTILHGEAVSVGTIAAIRVSAARGLCDSALLDVALGAFAAFGLPVTLGAMLGATAPGIAPDEIVRRTASDKKREGGRRRMVLPLREGGAESLDVSDADLRRALRECR